jgi:putative tryptophan/tyrosine transport system substrate-binding protein
MNLREFIAGLGSTVAWPLAAIGQSALPVVGFFRGTPAAGFEHFVAAFRLGLKDTGYIDGQNVMIEYRWTDGQYDRLPTLAADLVRRRVAVIAASGNAAALAAKAATTTIPIVFGAAFDPVQAGLVASLNRPGGNVTGATNLAVELGPKRLELLHELVPTANVVAVLFNPSDPTSESQSRDLQAAAHTIGLQLHILHANTERDFDAVFANLAQLRIGALVIGADAFFNARIEQLAALTTRYAMPAIYQVREFAAAGGLMSYGGGIAETHRQVGVYAGRILKGEKPADLPVQQITKVELVINLKTAKALGITFPLTLLGRADEVIE